MAASGSVFVREGANIIGDLMIAPAFIGGAYTLSPPVVPVAAELPALSPGLVTSIEETETGSWITGAEALTAEWLGTWMRLFDAESTVIGTYPVSQIDNGGRVFLDGASAVNSAIAFGGLHMFRRLDVLPGATLVANQPLHASHIHLWDGAALVAEAPVPASALRGYRRRRYQQVTWSSRPRRCRQVRGSGRLTATRCSSL